MSIADRTEARWGRQDDPDDAFDRLLDATGRVVLEVGLAGLRMGAVAREARCSRGTIYRYFADRDELRRAFITREATRIGAVLARSAPTGGDAGRRLTSMVLAAVREVRRDPVLLAWFDPAAAGLAGRLSLQSEMVGELIDAFLGEVLDELRPDLDRALAVQWIERVVLSMLSHPASAKVERQMLEQFLVPSLS